MLSTFRKYSNTWFFTNIEKSALPIGKTLQLVQSKNLFLCRCGNDKYANQGGKRDGLIRNLETQKGR